MHLIYGGTGRNYSGACRQQGKWSFGRNAISEIYGKMGILETEDFMAIGKWLKQQSWVDTSKLCIMGL